MSLTVSERRSQDDRIRQTQEESQEKELQTIKKKNAELKRAEQRHQEEIKRLTEVFQEEVNELKTGGREKLNSRDLEFQKKISEMREAQKNQLRKQMTEGSEERAAIKESYQSELEKQKEIKESQERNLTSQQKNELRDRDEKIESILHNSKTEVEQGLSANKRRFQEAHSKETKALIADRNNQAQIGKAENQRLRETYEAELKNLNRKNALEVGTWNQKYMDLAKNNQRESQERLEDQTVMFDEMRNQLTDKYQRSFESKNKARADGNDVFRDTVNERINNQIHSKDSQIGALKSQISTQESHDAKLRGLEQMHLRDTYEAKFKDIQDDKDQLREVFQDLAHKRVGEAQRKNEDILRQTNREYKSQRAMIDSQRGRDRQELTELHKSELENSTQLSEKRLERIENAKLGDTKKLGEFYHESVEQLRDNYSNKLIQQREENLSNVAETNKNLAKRFRDREAALTNRIETLTNNFEEKIEKIKDDHDKELKHIEALYSQKMAEKEKTHKFEKDSMSIKYESKLAQVDDQNQDRFERLQKKHEEDIKNLSVRYSRKA